MRKLGISLQLVLAGALPIIMTACASLSLHQVDFAWPVESSLPISNSNLVEDGRYAIAFSVTPLAMEEFQDSTALRGKSLRILRNSSGFYFVTCSGFKNVYVFAPGEGTLKVSEKINMGKNTDGQEIRLNEPALNQRPPYVELLDGTKKLLLSSDGIVKQETGGMKQ